MYNLFMEAKHYDTSGRAYLGPLALLQLFYLLEDLEIVSNPGALNNWFYSAVVEATMADVKVRDSKRSAERS